MKYWFRYILSLNLRYSTKIFACTHETLQEFHINSQISQSYFLENNRSKQERHSNMPKSAIKQKNGNLKNNSEFNEF